MTPSRSKPDRGVVKVKTDAYKQDGTLVATFKRAVPRAAPKAGEKRLCARFQCWLSAGSGGAVGVPVVAWMHRRQGLDRLGELERMSEREGPMWPAEGKAVAAEISERIRSMLADAEAAAAAIRHEAEQDAHARRRGQAETEALKIIETRGASPSASWPSGSTACPR